MLEAVAGILMLASSHSAPDALRDSILARIAAQPGAIVAVAG